MWPEGVYRMLVVEAYVAPSAIHGMGVFAAEPLKAGTRVWVFNAVIDQEITPAELEMLPEVARRIALSRGFVSSDGRTILSRDNGVFLNHSDEPNTQVDEEGSAAARDIAMGEELTE